MVTPASPSVLVPPAPLAPVKVEKIPVTLATITDEIGMAGFGLLLLATLISQLRPLGAPLMVKTVPSMMLTLPVDILSQPAKVKTD
jgi:hypothetical protein